MGAGERHCRYRTEEVNSKSWSLAGKKSSMSGMLPGSAPSLLSWEFNQERFSSCAILDASNSRQRASRTRERSLLLPWASPISFWALKAWHSMWCIFSPGCCSTWTFLPEFTLGVGSGRRTRKGKERGWLLGMVCFKMHTWDINSSFADLSFLPQSPRYVFLLLGSIPTVSLAAGEEGQRSWFLQTWLGKKIWFLYYKAQIHLGFKYVCISDPRELLSGNDWNPWRWMLSWEWLKNGLIALGPSFQVE